jgi:hypothetical protein
LKDGVSEEEAHKKCEWQRYYDTAIHEAGHGVMHCRTKASEEVPLVSLEIFEEGSKSKYHGLATGVLCNIATVAGHFAQYRWGWCGKKNSSSFGGIGDFDILAKQRAEYRHYCLEEHYDNSKPRVKKCDKLAARKTWNENMKKLSRLARRYPSFELQVRAVAEVLVEKRRLSGEEVLDIMKTVAV